MTNRNEDWKNSNFKATFSNKNNEQDDITNIRASKEKENCYNLNIATFTFGGRQSNAILEMNPENINSNSIKKSGNIRNTTTSKDKSQENYEDENKNLYSLPKRPDNNCPFSYNTNNTQNSNNSVITNISTNQIHNKTAQSIINNNNQNRPSQLAHLVGPTLNNRIGDHNSFLSVVIHALWNLKFIRSFIINDLNTLNEKESKNKLFYHLKSLFLKYERNKSVDITKVRNALAETFQNRRKFLLDQPDDPVDCYFSFINSIHSHFIVNLIIIFLANFS